MMTRGKIDRLILTRIREHAPQLAGGAGLYVRRSGSSWEIGFSLEVAAKLAALTDPAVTYGSAAGAQMGPPGGGSVPALPRPPMGPR